MKRVVIISLFLALAGCTSVSGVLPVRTISEVQVRDKNYELGTAKTVVVGNSLIKVREYNIRNLNPISYSVENSTDIVFNGREYRIERGQVFSIEGSRVIDGVSHDVVKFTPFHLTYGFQIHPDGSVNKEVLYEHPNQMMWTVIKFDIEKSSQEFRMIPVENVKYETFSGDRNYEIVFNGNDGNSLKFQYREYTSDNMARPAFYQDLSYINTSEYIRFRDLVIRLVDVGSDNLTYVVEQD